MDNDPNELITIYELCETLAIGRNAAYRLLNSKPIPAFRIGKVWKIPKEGITSFIRKEAGLNIPQQHAW